LTDDELDELPDDEYMSDEEDDDDDEATSNPYHVHQHFPC